MDAGNATWTPPAGTVNGYRIEPTPSGEPAQMIDYDSIMGPRNVPTFGGGGHQQVASTNGTTYSARIAACALSPPAAAGKGGVWKRVWLLLEEWPKPSGMKIIQHAPR